MFQPMLPRFGEIVEFPSKDFELTRKLLSTPSLMTPVRRKRISSSSPTKLPLKKRKPKSDGRRATFLQANSPTVLGSTTTVNEVHVSGPIPMVPLLQLGTRRARNRPEKKRLPLIQRSLPGNSLPRFHVGRPPPPAQISPPLYGWHSVDRVKVPYVFRGEQKFVSVSMFDDQLLLQYPARYPSYLLGNPPVVCYPGLFQEITLLNRLQETITGPSSTGPLIVGDLLAPLEGILDFYSAVKAVYQSMRPSDLVLDRVVSGSWIQLNDTAIPCIKRLLVAEQKCRMMPLSMIAGAARSSSDLSQFSLRATPEECKVLSRMCSKAGLMCRFDVGTQLITLKDLVCHINWLSNIILLLNDNKPLQNSDQSQSQLRLPTVAEREPVTETISTTTKTQQDSGISISRSSIDAPPPLTSIPVPVMEHTNTSKDKRPSHPVTVPIPVLECARSVTKKDQLRPPSLDNLTRTSPVTANTFASTSDTHSGSEPRNDSGTAGSLPRNDSGRSSMPREDTTRSACSHKAPRVAAYDQGERLNQVCTCGLPTLGEIISDINAPRTLHNRAISLSRPEIGKGFSRSVPPVRPGSSGRKALLLRVRKVIEDRTKQPDDSYVEQSGRAELVDRTQHG